MKPLLLILTLFTSLVAQTSSPSETVITSDQFKLDMTKNEGVFTGNVVVIGSDFKMKALEMTVYSSPQNKVQRIVARGQVEIERKDSIARANQAEFIVAEDKMILTGSPEVTQNKNLITGTTITIYRKSSRMDVDGRSRVVLYEEVGPNK